MAEEVMLSVITATKDIIVGDRADQLIRCVESVSKVSIPHEHIICDGASLDGTLDLLNLLSERNNGLVIDSRPDSGIYSAFNRGIYKASGKWLYFLGSDDYLTSPEILSEVIEEANSASTEMVISPVSYSNGSYGFKNMDDCRNILIIKPYCHQGVLMTKTAIERSGLFNESYRIASDFELCLQAHLSNIPSVFIKRCYACFSTERGVSSIDKRERQERLDISRRLLNVPYSGEKLLFSKQLLPYRVIFRLLKHDNPIIRKGARYAMVRRIANILGMLDDMGGPRNAFQKLGR